MFGFPSWIVIAAACAIAAAGGGWTMHAIDLGTINGMKAAQATAVAEAIASANTEQKRVDKVAMDSAVAQAEAQQRETIKTVTVTKWITRHVKDVVGCPSLDLVRVHDAAALGADPESLTETTAQPNDGGAVITTTAFSDAINENYGACRANAEQLTGLETWVRNTLGP